MLLQQVIALVFSGVLCDIDVLLLMQPVLVVH